MFKYTQEKTKIETFVKKRNKTERKDKHAKNK